MATLDGQAFQRIQPKQYFTQFIKYNIRPDGRGLQEVREVKVRQGVLNRTCAGSAVVAAGHTRFVVGITAELGSPLPTAPRSGRIVVGVEFSRNCCADADAAINGLASQTTWALTQMLSSGDVFDAEQLCVKEGIAVWVLYVTVFCLEYDGSALDWALCACTAALRDTKLPSLVWCPKGKWWRVLSDSAAAARALEETSLSHSQDINHKLLLPWVGRRLRLTGIPLSLTLLHITDKEKSSWIADPTFAETAQGETLTAWCVLPTPSDADSLALETESLNRINDVGGWRLLRSGGEPVDIQGSLHMLVPVIHSAFQSLRSALVKAAEEASSEDLWEVCGHEDEDTSTENEDSEENPNDDGT